MAKVIVLTGASRGIGVSIAEDLAKDGHVLVLAARDRAGLEKTAEKVRAAGGKAIVVPGDIAKAADQDALIAAAEAVGPIDILINNAGVEIAKAVASQSPAEIELQLLIDLHAPILLTRKLLPKMIDRKAGAVVMISSMSGKSPTPYNAIYAAAKHGINGFVKSLRLELEGSGVQVGVVCPSFVADAGMWADTGVKAPAAMREVPLARVVAGVRRVIAGEGEVLVTPAPVRPLLALSELFPGLNGPVMRAMGVVDALKQRDVVVRGKKS